MRWTRETLFVLIGLLVALLVGVLVLELGFGGWLRDDPWRATQRLNIVRNLRIDYQLSGNIYGMEDVRSVPYARDRWGLRSGCAQPAQIDILTIGGSTTDQRAVRDGQTFQDVLQARLTQAVGRPVCVANAGVDGHSSYGHLESFRRWFPLIPGLKPRLYLLYIGVNDAGMRLAPQAGFDTNETAPDTGWRATLREKSALYGLYELARTLLSGATTQAAYGGHAVRPPRADEYIADRPAPDIDALVQRNAAGFRQRLDAILREIAARGGQPVCVAQPHLFTARIDGQVRGTAKVFEFEGRSFNGLDYDRSIRALDAVMRQACPQAGGWFVDMAHRSWQDRDFYDGVHMTPAGTARLGEYLFDELQQQGIAARLR